MTDASRAVPPRPGGARLYLLTTSSSIIDYRINVSTWRRLISSERKGKRRKMSEKHARFVTYVEVEISGFRIPTFLHEFSPAIQRF